MNNEDEIVYGMLMRKVVVNEEMYLFVPVHLIEGIMLAENVFADELGKDYYVIDPNLYIQNEELEVDDENLDYIDMEEEYYIGSTITKKELLNSFKGEILENAKMYFYQSIKNNCLFAYYDNNSDEFKSLYFDISTFTDAYDILTEQQESDINTYSDTHKELDLICTNKDSLKNGASVLIMTQEDIANLINLYDKKDYSKLIEILQNYKNNLETPSKEVNETPNIESNNNSIIKDEIDVNDFYNKTRQKIIGQDEAIKDIISAVKMDQYSKTPSEKNRCFIIGPTGTGKTEIIKCLGEYLDKPTVKVDTTQITTPGYVGGKLEDFLSRLVSMAGGNIEKAENGIITFDEIDKKCGKVDELFGQGFLYTLLPFLDGTDYTIKVDGKTRNFNTSRLTIFASGSFSEIIKNASLDKKSIGFNKTTSLGNINKMDSDQIFKSAFMPEEIIGRFPVVIQLNPHTKESLSQILVNSDISQLKAEKRKFEYLGVNLYWEDKYIEAVAEKAIKLNIGARSLKKIVEESIKELRWEILSNPNKYRSAQLLEDTVYNPKVYRLK